MQTEVIIVGSSFIGLTTAILLAQNDINVVLVTDENIESIHQEESAHSVKMIQKIQNSASNKYPEILFAIATKSIDILSKAINSNAENLGQPINQVRIVDGNTKYKADFIPENIDMKAFGAMISESKLKNALLQEITKYDIRIAKSQLIENLNATNHSIKIQYIDSDKKNCSVTGKIILACDGKYSRIRELCHISCNTIDFKQIGLVCDIEHNSWNHRGIAVEKFYKTGPFAILPKQDPYKSAIVWSCNAKTAETLAYHDKIFIKELLMQRLNGYLGEIETITEARTYAINEIKAKKIYSDRVLLLGDAAHAIHPIAGQGLNLGLRGVSLAVTMLCEFKKLGIDIGSEFVLREYAKQRRIDCNIMSLSTRQINSIFLTNNQIIKMFRSAGIRIFDNIPYIKKLVMKYATGTHHLIS